MRLTASALALVCSSLLLATGCGPAPTPNDLGAPSVVVAITPPNAALNGGQQQTFVATVTGSNDTQVTWSVAEGGGGSITVDGVYTAPAATGTYTVVAISHADPTAQATAKVTVTAVPQVSVSITPASATVAVGGTQAFTASVTNATDTGVTWTVMEAGGGTIASDGTYTAPATAGDFHVIATSKQDPTKMSAALVHVTVAVSVTPATATLNAAQTQTFFATVTGSSNGAVTWSVLESGGGTIDAGGLYTAPSGTGTFHVVAKSVADATVSGTATVTVTSTPQVSVSVTPATKTLDEGAQQVFVATVTNPGGGSTAVTWSVLESGGGNVASGTYTAPFKAGTYHVIATSVADPTKTAVATVTVSQATLMLDVTSATLDEGETLTFHATLTNISDPAVDWSIMETAGGSVAGGLYTAPLHPGTFHVIASSHSDTSLSATATVTVRPITISVTPTPVTLDQGAQQAFTATVTGVVDKTVNWTATCGTLAANVYTAPTAAGDCTVTATSNADITKAGSALVHVRPVVVMVSPPGPLTLDQGAAQAFTATVTGSVDTSFHWSADCGVVDVNGNYLAPMNQAAAQTCKVAATSNADNTAFSKATVNVNALSLAITENAVTLDQGAQHTFQATVTGIVNKTVSWGVLCTPVGTGGGINASSGLFTAPHVAGSGSSCAVIAQAADGATSPSSTATVNPVALALTPGGFKLANGQAGQFVATVTGAVDHSVTYSVVEAGGGTISPSGVYIAPSSGAGPYTVMAVANADVTRQQTGDVKIATAVSVAVSPATIDLGVGQTQAFFAQVTGSSNGGVSWSASAGSITPTGVFTAPNAAGTATITATSLADGTKTGTATVNVVATQQIVVSVTPPSVTASPLVPVQFAAVVSGTANQSVFWDVAEGPAGGTITQGGLYTPSGAPGTYHVTARSNQDSTRKGSATVTVSTGLPVTVSVAPPSVILGPNQGKVFTATVGGASNTQVVWSLGAGSVGSIDPSTGLYIAPSATTGSATVIATSVADSTKTGQATVTLTGTISVAVNPSSTTIPVGTQQAFTATVTGTSNQNVIWSVSCSASAPSITTAGVLTAPATAQSCTVTATGAGATVGNATVQIVTPGNFTISGTVGYSGAAGSHSVFLTLFDSGGESTNGTHITAPGPFTIRGVTPGKVYNLLAWDDVEGAVSINTAIDPWAGVSIPGGPLSGDVTGLTVTLNPPTPQTPVAPTVQFGVSGGLGGLGIDFTHPGDSNGNEFADHYTVYLSTSPTPGPTDNIMVRRIEYWSESAMMAPLPPGNYYVAVSAGNSLGDSPLSAPYGPIPVQAKTGGNTVTGTLTLPPSLHATGPIYIFVLAGDQQGIPLNVSSTLIQNPGASNPFVLTGAPSGNLEYRIILDQLNDGMIGVHDPTLQGTVTVNGDTSLGTLGFASGNAQFLLGTNHTCDTSQTGSICDGTPAQTDQTSMNIQLDPLAKVPVMATILSGDHTNGLVPMDIGVQAHYNTQHFVGTRFLQFGTPPVLGDQVTLLVTYDDGSTDVLTKAVSAILPYPIVSTSTAPLSFSWTGLVSSQELHDFSLFQGNNSVWQFDFVDRKQAPPLLYAGPALSSGQSYRWYLYTEDNLGNTAAAGMSFIAP